MGDQKSAYSSFAVDFVSVIAEASKSAAHYLEEANARKARYGARWAKVSVNLVDICDEFAPGAAEENRGHKLIFRGERYTVICDPVGYVRIWDKQLRRHVDLEGNPVNDKKSHFRILKRKEM